MISLADFFLLIGSILFACGFILIMLYWLYR